MLLDLSCTPGRSNSHFLGQREGVWHFRRADGIAAGSIDCFDSDMDLD